MGKASSAPSLLHNFVNNRITASWIFKSQIWKGGMGASRHRRAPGWVLSRLLFWRRGGSPLRGHTEKWIRRVGSFLVVGLPRAMYCWAAPGVLRAALASRERCG